MEELIRMNNRLTKLVDKTTDIPIELNQLSKLKFEIEDLWKQIQSELKEIRAHLLTTDADQSVAILETKMRDQYQQALDRINLKLSQVITEQLGAEMVDAGETPLGNISIETTPPAFMTPNPDLSSTLGPDQINRSPELPPRKTGTIPKVKKVDKSEEWSPSQKTIIDAMVKQLIDQFKEKMDGKNNEQNKPSISSAETKLGESNYIVTLDDTGRMSNVEPMGATYLTNHGHGYNEPLDINDDKKIVGRKTKPKINDPPQLPTIELKLDKIQLQTFDGDWTEWITFRDQFTDLVHENPRLTKITKFCQLQSHLKGIAFEAIKGFTLTATDYDAAWFTLCKRYNNTQRLIDEYLRKFSELPHLTYPNAAKLIGMVNRTNQLLRVLPQLGIDVKTWDTWITYNLKLRLDHVTQRKWLDQVKLRQHVPLQELLEFLEVEASEFVSTEYEKRHIPKQAFGKSTPKRFNKKRGPTTMIVEPQPQQGATERRPTNYKCSNCKQDHPIFRCPTFRALVVNDRIKKIKVLGLCIRCLRSHEHPADCKFGACPSCKKDHNLMLCYAREKQQLANKKPNVAQIKVTESD